jgi:hypothetical protein
MVEAPARRRAAGCRATPGDLSTGDGPSGDGSTRDGSTGEHA